jgi:site-specific recombinase XerD
MADRFFAHEMAWQGLRAGPLRAHIDSFVGLLSRRGYAESSSRGQIRSLAELSRWLQRRGLGVDGLDEKRLAEFLDSRCTNGRVRRGERAALRAFLEHLRGVGAVAVPIPAGDGSPLQRIERRFSRYLIEERGLSPATLLNYVPIARRFLTERFRTGPVRLRLLCAADISRFVLRHAHSFSPGRARLMVSALRAFLRFLHVGGEIAPDLAASVPSVANWRLSTVPKYLEPEQVERLLRACDRSRSAGRRDYAILLLLARLGLRAAEVVSLTLDDIDWRAGELTVRGKGLRQARLPMPRDVGKALATYLRQDRPRRPTRQVFLRMRAPLRGFASSAAICTIVCRALARAGLQPPHRGAHLLRHSLATRMLRHGASLAEIGQILRHRLPQTTEIYAKVDLGALHALAQPWPLAGGEA